jgi:hypothetical protein
VALEEIMGRRRLLGILALVALIVLVTPAVVFAAPADSVEAQRGRGDDDRRGGDRDRRDGQREAERAIREAQREAERAAERAQREAQRAAREAQEDAERAVERAAREARREWRDLAQFRWDPGRPWAERVLELPIAAQPVSVAVLVPQTTPNSFVPSFANTLQYQVLPSLTQVVPPEVFPQAPLQFWQVQPNAFMLAHPELFWDQSDYWSAQQFASQLPMPGFQPIVMNGPLGYGTYLLLFLG